MLKQCRCRAGDVQDYRPPPYLVGTVHLNFLLGEDVTRVESTLRLQPNWAGEQPDLFLNGAEALCEMA